jgi:hypothetical protein
MKDVCGVHGLEGAKGLVDEVLAMVVGEFLGADNAMHVSLHEFLEILLTKQSAWWKVEEAYLDEVHFSKSLVVPRLLDVENGDDVFVVEVSQQLHLAQSSQTKHGVVERCDLLDGDLLT